MKKLICLLLALCMLFALAACGEKKEEPEQAAAEWTRQGYYMDEDGNMLSVTRMDDVDEPGWYVGFMNGDDLMEDSYGGMLPQEGNALRGELPNGGSRAPIKVTVSEEGEDGLQLVVEGGETYHLSPLEMESAVATLWVNTEGYGFFTCSEQGQESDDTLWTSAQHGLAEPTSFVLAAQPGEDWYFVKWTLNGEDYSTDEQITLEVAEDADLIAVFDFAGGDFGEGEAASVGAAVAEAAGVGGERERLATGYARFPVGGEVARLHGRAVLHGLEENGMLGALQHIDALPHEAHRLERVVGIALECGVQRAAVRQVRVDVLELVEHQLRRHRLRGCHEEGRVERLARLVGRLEGVGPRDAHSGAAADVSRG